jgi:hypothetical protein
MKFYKDNRYSYFYYYNKIITNKLNAIYFDSFTITFFKNAVFHSFKNASYIKYDGYYKDFYLNGIFYGDHNKFTKKSWRRFCKLQAFL